jgi:hypothetical protein
MMVKASPKPTRPKSTCLGSMWVVLVRRTSMTGRCACARSPKDGMLLWELSAMRLLQNPMGTQGQLHVPREGASILLISRGPPSPNVIFASSASASPILSKKTLMFSSKLPPPLKTLASDQQMSPHRR